MNITYILLAVDLVFAEFWALYCFLPVYGFFYLFWGYMEDSRDTRCPPHCAFPRLIKTGVKYSGIPCNLTCTHPSLYASSIVLPAPSAW